MTTMGEIFTKRGWALDGFDVVHLLDHLQVVSGNTSFQVEYRDAVWLFTSSRTLQAFKENPGKYMPAYGGFCAYGISQGYKAPTRINLFTIVDGVLYFNFSPYIKRYWVQHQQLLIGTANDQWPQIKTEPTIRVNYYWIYLKYLTYKALGVPFFGTLPTSQGKIKSLL